MIPYPRDPQQTIPSSAVKIIGLGGAGANILERVALDGTEGAELLALNTDTRTLAACVAGEKIQLGRNLTKGLGAGGDPELGHQAMLEAEPEIRAALRGRRIVFLCVGLGGGTGSGAAPVLTRLAREEGAFVVVFATMPFAFEGRRRREQAETTLNELAVLANALVTFDNNRMGELVLAKQGIHEAFAAADHMICESIKAVIRLVIRPGIINVGLDDLMSALRTNRSRCLFGSGLAKGKDRSSNALRNALASPLLDQGALLKQAQTVLVHLSGGESLTLYEVELLMQRLAKFVPATAHILFGAAIDPAMGDSLSVTLISALPEDALAGSPRESLSDAGSILLDPVESFAVEPAPVPRAPELTAPSAPVLPAPVVKPPPLVEAPSLFDDQSPFAEPAPTPAAVATPAPDREPEPEPEPEPAPVAEPHHDLGPDLNDDDPVAPAIPAPTFKQIRRIQPSPKPLWGKAIHSHKPAAPELAPEPTAATESPQFPHDSPFTLQPPAATEAPLEPEPESETPKLKLGVKLQATQNELAFDSAPRGRFEGQAPTVTDGEDLDLPPFLRKKK